MNVILLKKNNLHFNVKILKIYNKTLYYRYNIKHIVFVRLTQLVGTMNNIGKVYCSNPDHTKKSH